jgi:hypothetical protein
MPMKVFFDANSVNFKRNYPRRRATFASVHKENMPGSLSLFPLRILLEEPACLLT